MSNYLEILMIIVALLLVVVIWSLSSVLSMMAKKVVEQSKHAKKELMIFFIATSSIYSNKVLAQDLTTDTTAVKEVINYGGMTSTGFWTMSTVIALEILVVLLLVVFIKNLWKSLYPTVQNTLSKNLKSSWMVATWNKLDKHFFTKAAPIEKEADIMLDHDYDGIKELDNALPPWWKYGFYITILVGIFYFLKFEVWKTGQDQIQEFTTEMNEAKMQTDAYLATMKENVDEKTVVMSDAEGVAKGKELFSKTCVACHLSNGEGGVGPNLTDDYWIHGGSINDIFKTIKYGFPDKGMQAWASTFSPVQMQQLSSYIKTLKGTNPANAKAAQGDLYTETVVKLDSVTAK